MSKYSFSKIANVKFSRSKFDLSQQHKTTMNVGDLCPVYVQEVYPGDSFKIKAAFVARASVPFLKVPMDNLFMDMYYFFVPNRLVYDKWAEVFGENKSSAWVPQSSVSAPMITSSGMDSCVPGTVANYFGIPYVASPTGGIQVNDLPFRAFALIWNEWFRDENVQAPVYINTAATTGGSLNTNAWSSTNYYGKVPKINKVHDYFTSCLPGTQKGTAANVPLNASLKATVKAGSDQLVTSSSYGMQIKGVTGTTLSAAKVLGFPSTTSGVAQVQAGTLPSGTTFSGNVYPTNLYADLGNLAAINVNDLRFAFQLQKMLELDARGGTRYTEYLLNHFGTVNPDARLQRPEFLGGKRQPLTMQQVASTVPELEVSGTPQASVSAYSLSGGVNKVSKSFTEHGFIIGVAAIRYYHTYQQGIERFWYRKDRLDYYDPLFAHLGEQPVYRKELYALGATTDNAVFGYQEPWADLRFRKNLVTGALTTNANQGLDVWHFADNYSSAPLLSDAFIQENGGPVDRALSASSSTIPNFLLDYYFNVDAIRVLPTFGTPGRIDHNM